jgi:hypothetical protein
MTALDLAVLELRRETPSRISPLLKIACLAVALIGGQVLLSGATEGYCLIWPGIGTKFAPGFSHTGFARIKPGMTAQEVVSLIGEPMGLAPGRGSPPGWTLYRYGDVTWSYSTDSSALGGDWAWLAREVVFRDGRVAHTVRWTYHD